LFQTNKNTIIGVLKSITPGSAPKHEHQTILKFQHVRTGQ
jgi:hypothetical protein